MTTVDHCVYVRKFDNGKFVIIPLYVDYMLIVGRDSKMIGWLKRDMSKTFDMKDLCLAQQILGMQIRCDRNAKKQ